MIPKFSSIILMFFIGFFVLAGGLMAEAGQEQFLQGTWSDHLTVEGFPTFPMYCTYFTDLVWAEVGGPLLCTFVPIEIPGPGGKLLLGGTGHGTWIQKNSYEFDFTLSFFVTDPSGRLIGKTKVTGVKHLNKSMDKYTGEGIDEIMDLNGNVMAKSNWTVEGTKVVVEPLD